MEAIAVCGPTSSGKSEIASRLAEEIGGEIVNADSRQIYEGTRIGTGWPSAQARARATHHLYGFVEPGERYSAGRYVADARSICERVARSGKRPIIVGGTGLYIEALSGAMPMDRPVADDELHERIRREAAIHEHDALRDWLATLDREAAARIPLGDRYRTLRALEAALAAREAPRARATDAKSIELRIFVLEVDRELLRTRIADRVRAMFADGIVEEAEAIRARWPDAPALSGIGYAEALAWRGGLASRGEALATTIRRTSQYAKRQQTWFNHVRGAARITANDPESARAAIAAAARESAARK